MLARMPPTFAVGSPRRRSFLSDLSLQLERLRGQVVVLRLQQERIKTAAMIDCLERVRRNAQLDRAAERVRDHGDVEQIGQEAPLGLDVGVADLVPNLRSLAGEFAPPRHRETLSFKAFAGSSLCAFVSGSTTCGFASRRTYKERMKRRQAASSQCDCARNDGVIRDAFQLP